MSSICIEVRKTGSVDGPFLVAMSWRGMGLLQVTMVGWGNHADTSIDGGSTSPLTSCCFPLPNSAPFFPADAADATDFGLNMNGLLAKALASDGAGRGSS